MSKMLNGVTWGFEGSQDLEAILYLSSGVERFGQAAKYYF